MEYKIVIGIIFFIIFMSVQYTLNKILVELKDVKKILIQMKIKD